MTLDKKFQLILASASPRRRELLGYLGVPFAVKPSNVDEKSSAVLPEDYVLEISKLKAEDIFNQYLKTNPQQPFLVVGADTTVFKNQKFYSKPKSVDEARSHLLDLSGETHSVYTGVVALFFSGKEKRNFSFAEKTQVTFEKISPYFLEKYLSTGESLDKAGAYGIQGESLGFISRIDGDYANVVGFPLSRFIQQCEDFFSPYLAKGLSWPDLF